MAEEKKDGGRGGDGGGDDGGSARVSTSFPGVASMASSSSQARQRFTIELRPDETTIASWKKLIKESNKSKPPPAPEPPSGAHPALESRIAPPGQPAECEGQEEPPTNRFSAVIEKIERLYVGNESSDGEELADVPDDDQYDTEDSFIDDADLDEYFQVDKSTTKHKGFFINRGTLERSNEHSSTPKDQPKKRRRKDLTTQFEKDDENLPNKHAKMGNVRMKAAARTAPLAASKTLSPSQSLAGKIDHYQDEKSFNKPNAPVGPSKKKSSDSNVKLEQHVPSETQRGRLETKDIEKQKTGVVQSRDPGSKLKVTGESSDAMHQIYQDKNSSSHIDPQSRRLLNDAKELEQSTKIGQREKSSSYESPNHNFSRTKNNSQTTKSPSIHLKDGCSVRPKGTILERSIRDLEDIVKESRPATMENQDADSSSQGIKRRLPREVKQKLAKVARLAQSSQGKITDELINRLMSIVGHIMQRKTLKRNLREMVVLGLSAKQEKDVKFQHIKKEIIEMIRMRAPYLNSKVSGQQDGASDDFQEVRGSEEKGVLKVKGSMDNAMEDKICDLYDLYVEGMDEDKNSQVRKLYVELAGLWPNGAMDNHGIKNAICRSKGRKRSTHNRLKNQEKTRQQGNVGGEGSPLGQAAHPVQERVGGDTSSQVLTSPNRSMPSVATSANQQQAALSSGKTNNNNNNNNNNNGSSLSLGLSLGPSHQPKQEKIKGGEEARKATTEHTLLVAKKKTKRKLESDVHFHHPDGKERHKTHRHDSNHPNKSADIQLPGFQGFEQFSS